MVIVLFLVLSGICLSFVTLTFEYFYYKKLNDTNQRNNVHLVMGIAGQNIAGRATDKEQENGKFVVPPRLYT